MTSIFDQYNNSIKRNGGDVSSITDPPSSGYVTIRIKQESPIFTKQKMKLNLPDDITHLAVSNNWLMCLMSHQVLLRLFLLRPDKQDEVFLEKYITGFKISKLFLDPTGNHLLITLSPKSPGQSPELLYLHSKSSKPKRIDRFKDHEITAIGFNYDNNSESSTGPILIGTSKGLIFETEFGIDGEKLFQSNWKQFPAYIPLYVMKDIEGLVFDIGRDKHCPITDIEFFRASNTNRYIVMAATPDKLYKFQENLKPDDKPILQNIFSAYLNIPERIENYEKRTSSLKYSRLRFYCESGKKYPTQFAWMTESGLFHGYIDQNPGNPEFVINSQDIPFPSDDNNKAMTTATNAEAKIPETFILTEFHALLLYSDHITAICLLNHQVIYEEYFHTEQYGKLLNIIKDFSSGSIYTYAEKCIFRYKITNEQRNVWKMYLEKQDFDLAEKYSKDNPANFDYVLCKKAEMHFLLGEYLQSAQIYSETQTSFEEVCLKFVELDDKKPLMLYLKNRLDKLRADDKTQITMLIVWMVELYLSEISHYANDAGKKKELQNEFDNFLTLTRVDECIKANRSVIYDIMASHGDTYNLNVLTTVNKDYESVINQYINQGKFTDALFILRKQNKPELYYKYCPILMEQIPVETVKLLIAQEKRLQPKNLLPTLICLNDDQHVQEVIKYLEFAIYKMTVTDVAIHNFLIKLYAKYNSDKLEMYLESEGRDLTLIHYDVYYALRVCEEHQCQTACVFLQCLLKLWYSAVELALTFDSKLAQKTASQPRDMELRRKLWLKIAEHEIKGKNDVKKALELLKDCDLLRIEDLLPYFSDFEKIDDFKEAICDALFDYNMKIQEQQKDMEESAKSAERVRNELQNIRNSSIRINASELCSICELYLLLKPFFVFPCGHKFHGDCLEKEIIPLLNPEQAKRLNSLKNQLENLLTQLPPLIISSGMNTENDSTATNGLRNSREQVKAEIENILAADCLYCGVMINLIDRPFIENWEQVNADWN